MQRSCQSRQKCKAGSEVLRSVLIYLGSVSITPFSYENGVECLRFWIGVSIENDRKRRHLKTVFKVE